VAKLRNLKNIQRKNPLINILEPQPMNR